jgi:hypothetical protein
MNKLVPVLMVVLSAVAIATIYLWQELREVRIQSDEVQTRITALQSARLTAVDARTVPAATTELQTVAVTAPAGATPTSPELPGTNSTAEKKPGNALQDLAQQMLGTPEGREMMMGQLRMVLPQQYPDLGRELELTPADTEKFFDMLVKHQMSTTADALELLGNNGQRDAAAAQERQRKAQEIQLANQAEVTAMLGDKATRWQQYQQTLPMRRQVNQLKMSLGTGNNALSDTQGTPLIAALAAEQSRIQQERRNAPRPPQQPGQPNPQTAIEQQLERAAEDNRRMVGVASSYLNPQQLDSYRQMLEQQQSMQRTLMRAVGSQSGR